MSSLKPIEFEEVLTAYYSTWPDAALPLRFPGRNEEEGFYIFDSGRFVSTSWGSASNRYVHVNSVVLGTEGNRLCAAPVGNWSGVCLEIFEGMSTGEYVVRYEYGNGYGGNFKPRNPDNWRRVHANFFG